MQIAISNINVLFDQYLLKVIAQQETIDSLNQFSSEIAVQTSALEDFLAGLSGIAILLGVVSAILDSGKFCIRWQDSKKNGHELSQSTHHVRNWLM